MYKSILAATAFLLLLTNVQAADWPMYRSDAARSGYTSEKLPEKLSLQWTYRSPHPPMPAWPTRNRERFDRAYRPVIAGGTLYYGSSADCKVYALDAATGETRWTFFTDGPVRFAPVAWRDRLFVASDDGHLYCLAAADGRLLWKLRGGPKDDMLLGNDRMISRWPARGGPVVIDDVLYFGAGIWPTEGIFIYAIDPATGKVLWCNDSSGGLEMDQPHGGARAKSGIAAQGHLAVSGDSLFIPTGRAVPAVFDRAGGVLRYFHLQRNQFSGGSDVVAIDNHFFNGGVMFATAGGAKHGAIGVQIAAHPDFVISSGKNRIVAFDRSKLLVDKEVTDRKGKKQIVKVLAPPAWSVELPEGALAPPITRKGTGHPGDKFMRSSEMWSRPILSDAPSALIIAGDKVVAGGRSKVLLIDVSSHETVWDAEVDGTVYGLAVAGGRLYVSTDRGTIYCFGDHKAATGGRADKADAAGSLTGLGATTGRGFMVRYEAAAEEIIRRTGVTEGYCLDIAAGECKLAIELAKRTKLQIYCVEKDPAKVQAARRMLDDAGLYGVRVTVHQADPAEVPYPDYFVDLVVSGRSVTEGPGVVPIKAVHRQQRPYGGTACIGKPGAMQQSARGPLEGAGSWTHQNADAANTLCSSDSLVHGPLEMLWFRDTDFVMPSRHGRGPAPLIDNGRMFTEGLHALRATNIYNGRTLWEYPLEGILLPYHGDVNVGAVWTGSNFCIWGNRVYVHTGNRCLCLDVATGRKVAALQPPPRPDGKPGTWGYIACKDGLLFGTLADEEYRVEAFFSRWDTSHLFTESVLFFAMDARTGELKWTFAPEHSIRHNAIAIGGGHVYLIDRPQASGDKVFYPPRVQVKTGRRPAVSGRRDGGEEVRWLTGHRTGRLLALDRETGKILWQTDKEVFGTMLAFSPKHNVLLMGYQSAHQDARLSELGDRMAGFRPGDGTRLWDVKADYESRPILNDRTIYAQPGAWNLLTGKRLAFSFTRSYGCGIPVGSSNMLVFRSATLGYFDLTGTRRTENYGGIRPGCWINAIPAGGLILMADAASWCTCSYLNQATCALQGVGGRR